MISGPDNICDINEAEEGVNFLLLKTHIFSKPIKTMKSQPVFHQENKANPVGPQDKHSLFMIRYIYLIVQPLICLWLKLIPSFVSV